MEPSRDLSFFLAIKWYEYKWRLMKIDSSRHRWYRQIDSPRKYPRTRRGLKRRLDSEFARNVFLFFSQS